MTRGDFSHAWFREAIILTFDRNMTTMTRLIKYTFAAVMLIATALPSHAAGEREVEAALEAVAEQRYADAFAHYRIAASLGNTDAQRSGGLMALYGGILYGTEIHADRAEALQWLELAAKNGCDICVYVLTKLAVPDEIKSAAMSAPYP